GVGCVFELPAVAVPRGGEGVHVDVTEVAASPGFEGDFSTGVGGNDFVDLSDLRERAVPESGLTVRQHSLRHRVEDVRCVLVAVLQCLKEIVVNFDADVRRPQVPRVGLTVDELEHVVILPVHDGHAGRAADTTCHDALCNGVVDSHRVHGGHLLTGAGVQDFRDSLEHEGKRVGAGCAAAEASEGRAAGSDSGYVIDALGVGNVSVEVGGEEV